MLPARLAGSQTRIVPDQQETPRGQIANRSRSPAAVERLILSIGVDLSIPLENGPWESIPPQPAELPTRK
jgi:hypothetical protein